MTSEPVVGVVYGCPVVGKTILSYIYLPFHSPTQASQLTGTPSYYRFRCHYPLITYLRMRYGARRLMLWLRPKDRRSTTASPPDSKSYLHLCLRVLESEVCLQELEAGTWKGYTYKYINIMYICMSLLFTFWTFSCFPWRPRIIQFQSQWF